MGFGLEIGGMYVYIIYIFTYMIYDIYICVCVLYLFDLLVIYNEQCVNVIVLPACTLP